MQWVLVDKLLKIGSTLSRKMEAGCDCIRLKKLEGQAISAAVLGPINAVLLSHDHHYDNLDPAGQGDLS